MRHLGRTDLLVVLGVAVLLWLGRYLLPDMQTPVSAQHSDSLWRGAKHMWNLPRRLLFWALIGFLALLAVTWALQPTPK